MEKLELDIKKAYYITYSYNDNIESASLDNSIVSIPHKYVSNLSNFDLPKFETPEQAINNIALDSSYDGLVYLACAARSRVDCSLYEESYVNMPVPDNQNMDSYSNDAYTYFHSNNGYQGRHILEMKIIRNGQELVEEIGKHEGVKSVYDDICRKVEFDRTAEKRAKDEEERIRNENFYHQWKKLDYLRSIGKFDEFMKIDQPAE